MKVLVVSQYYFPEQFQVNEIAPELVKRGHKVTVLCGLPNYPIGKIYPGYSDTSKLDETIDGVRVIRINQKPRGKNVLSLVRNYWSFVKEAKRRIHDLDGSFDVVLGYQLSPITSMIPAVEYSKVNNVPLLLYVLDIWPISGQAHLPIKNGLVYRWLARMSRKIYNSANRILVTSRPFINYLSDINGVPVEKMGYLPQHADIAMLNQDLSKVDNGITDFMFAGNLGAGATLEVIIKAASTLGNREDYTIHIVGDGSQKVKLERLAKKEGIRDRIVFHGNKSRAEMPDFYKMADALLITLRGNNEIGNTMPGKLQMYMTTGKPILGAINGAAKDVIEESKCGKCVHAGDYQGLAAVMRDFIENRDVYSNCGKNARIYFKENFTLEIFINGLEDELTNLIIETDEIQKTRQR